MEAFFVEIARVIGLNRAVVDQWFETDRHGQKVELMDKKGC
jgi:uncharacterized coiled-coil protein SlyX